MLKISIMASSPSVNWQLRLADEADIAALELLIPASVRALQASYYSPVQREIALECFIFGVDRQLIRDQTYFVVEHESWIVGCGGWSKRKSQSGGDRGRTTPDPEVDPNSDPARVRAFFVHPDWARRGIGRSILVASEKAIVAAGFSCAESVATLAGEPLYASLGYQVIKRFEMPMAHGENLPVVRMAKNLERNSSR
jgi:GNAT superfamily N-acetyltransferase